MKISLDDTGTRYVHYTELLELWESGIEIMQRRSRFSETDKWKYAELLAAISMLRQQIDILSDARDLVFIQRQLINSVPTDPAKIIGGRGTPLVENKTEE